MHFAHYAATKELEQCQNLPFLQDLLLILQTSHQSTCSLLLSSCHCVPLLHLTPQVVDLFLQLPPVLQVLLVSDLPKGAVVIKLEVALEDASNHSPKASLTCNIRGKASECLAEEGGVDGVLSFLHKGLNTSLVVNGRNVLLEEPHEDDFDLLVDHLVNPLHCLAELPVLETIPEEAVEEGELDLLLVVDDALDDGGKLGLLKLVLLLVQDFLNVLVLVEQVVVAELAALDFVADGLLQHEEPLLQDLAEGKVLIKCLL